MEKERELKRVNEGTILVVDDDALSRRYMRDLLVGEGFSVIDIDDPRRVGNILKEREIDVVILDLNLPFMKGTEVLYEIKKDVFLKHVPVIIVSTENEVLERIKSMYSGADEYIVKPLEGGEFLTRVKVVLRRSRQDLDANPLTKFPGNVSIQREIDKLIKGKVPFAIGYIDLDKFKEFNDYYGFKRGDEVIKLTAGIIIEALHHNDSPINFAGHIGGDDFVVVTTPELIDNVCNFVIESFNKRIVDFYDEDDRSKGYIISRDRKGSITKVSMLTVSLGVVVNKSLSLKHIGQISQLGADLKAQAKAVEGSSFVKKEF